MPPFQKVLFTLARFWCADRGFQPPAWSFFLEPDATRERIAVIEEGDERLRHGGFGALQPELPAPPPRERWAWAEF